MFRRTVLLGTAVISMLLLMSSVALAAQGQIVGVNPPGISVADGITDVGPPPGISVADGITDVADPPPGINVPIGEVFASTPGGKLILTHDFEFGNTP